MNSDSWTNGSLVYVKGPFVDASRVYWTAREAKPRESEMNSRCMNKRHFNVFKPREQKHWLEDF